MILRISSIALVAAALGCSTPTPEPAPQPAQVAIQEPGETAETTETPTPTEDQHCLPLVSGCGCAYVCARSLRRIDAERWAVVHDYQDSRVDEATIERWCFDETGVGSSAETGSTGEACQDVFYDRTPCGGECAPTTDFLECHFVDDRCIP